VSTKREEGTFRERHRRNRRIRHVLHDYPSRSLKCGAVPGLVRGYRIKVPASPRAATQNKGVMMRAYPQRRFESPRSRPFCRHHHTSALGSRGPGRSRVRLLPRHAADSRMLFRYEELPNRFKDLRSRGRHRSPFRSAPRGSGRTQLHRLAAVAKSRLRLRGEGRLSGWQGPASCRILLVVSVSSSRQPRGQSNV
jgi:hypothetical protein